MNERLRPQSACVFFIATASKALRLPNRTQPPDSWEFPRGRGVARQLTGRVYCLTRNTSVSSTKRTAPRPAVRISTTRGTGFMKFFDFVCRPASSFIALSLEHHAETSARPPFGHRVPILPLKKCFPARRERVWELAQRLQ